jgi:Preprotein translocase subunit SecD
LSLRIKLKIALLVFLILFSVFLLLPTFVKDLPPWFKKYVYRGELKLGLDLKGGVHLVLRPDLEKALKNQFDNYLQDIKAQALRANINFELIPEENKATFKFYKEEDLRVFKDEIIKGFKELQIIKEGKEKDAFFVEVSLSQEKVSYIREHILDQVLEVIRNRIDQFGVAEPIITKQGSDKIVIQLPGLKDPQRAINVVGQTAQLEFKLVDEEAMQKLNLDALINSLIREKKISLDTPIEEWRKLIKPYIPSDSEFYFLIEKDRTTGKIVKKPIILKKEAVLTGTYLKMHKLE